MKLSEWMAAHNIDDDVLAEKLAIDRSTASRIRRGKQKPSWGVAARILDVTGGDVPLDSFLDSSEAA